MLSAPAVTRPEDAAARLDAQGYAVLDSEGVRAWSGCSSLQLQKLCPYWDDLPPDSHLKDGGRYRRRRHSCFVARGERLDQVAHRAHWQSLEYNALHGGMQRWFEPVAADCIAQPGWQSLLLALTGLATPPGSAPAGPAPVYVEAHQFRIDTTDGIGRPTPEGAHRDGVDLVAVFLVGREAIKGGETRVFDAAGTTGVRFTLAEPWSLLLLDDRRVIHETTPIQPVGGATGHRDTLVLTCRAGGFQGD